MRKEPLSLLVAQLHHSFSPLRILLCLYPAFLSSLSNAFIKRCPLLFLPNRAGKLYVLLIVGYMR